MPGYIINNFKYNNLKQNNNNSLSNDIIKKGLLNSTSNSLNKGLNVNTAACSGDYINLKKNRALNKNYINRN